MNINQSNFYSANIPGVARLSSAIWIVVTRKPSVSFHPWRGHIWFVGILHREWHTPCFLCVSLWMYYNGCSWLARYRLSQLHYMNQGCLWLLGGQVCATVRVRTLSLNLQYVNFDLQIKLQNKCNQEAIVCYWYPSHRHKWPHPSFWWCQVDSTQMTCDFVLFNLFNSSAWRGHIKQTNKQQPKVPKHSLLSTSELEGIFTPI